MSTQMMDRIQNIRASLEKYAIDTLLVSMQGNRRYLSGFTGEDTQCDESAGSLFITAKELILATDPRFDVQAAQEANAFEIICYTEGLSKLLPDILRRLRTQRLGFESIRMAYSVFEDFKKAISEARLDLQMVPTQGLVEQFREVKDEKEIQLTREALLLAENAFLGMRDNIAPGMTEKQIAWILEKEMREAGAEALSFPCIVASGPNSALPHAIPGNRVVKKGEPLLFDWGAKLGGYCSDTSRTLTFGDPDPIYEKVFQTVVDAQKKAIDAIREGASTLAVDRVARSHIDSQGFKDKFGHGLGHGTGLNVHEGPRLSPLKDSVLKSGMIVTVEPGIYLADWGGVRVENQVVVRKDGAEILNTLPESL